MAEEESSYGEHRRRFAVSRVFASSSVMGTHCLNTSRQCWCPECFTHAPPPEASCAAQPAPLHLLSASTPGGGAHTRLFRPSNATHNTPGPRASAEGQLARQSLCMGAGSPARLPPPPSFRRGTCKCGNASRLLKPCHLHRGPPCTSAFQKQACQQATGLLSGLQLPRHAGHSSPSYAGRSPDAFQSVAKACQIAGWSRLKPASLATSW